VVNRKNWKIIEEKEKTIKENEKSIKGPISAYFKIFTLYKVIFIL